VLPIAEPEQLGVTEVGMRNVKASVSAGRSSV
jgi:hypothetical protein